VLLESNVSILGFHLTVMSRWRECVFTTNRAISRVWCSNYRCLCKCRLYYIDVELISSPRFLGRDERSRDDMLRRSTTSQVFVFSSHASLNALVVPEFQVRREVIHACTGIWRRLLVKLFSNFPPNTVSWQQWWRCSHVHFRLFCCYVNLWSTVQSYPCAFSCANYAPCCDVTMA